MPPTRISVSLLLCFALAGCQTHAASPAPGLGSSVVPGATDPSRAGLHASAAACDAAGAKAAIKSAPAAVDAADRDGMTPLALAARVGCLPVVSALVAAGAQPDVVEERSGWTALHHAAAQRHAKVVDYLLAHGAHQERKTRAGQTPLGLALVTAPRYYGPTGDRHTTEMVLLSGKARARIGAPIPAVAMKSPAKKKRAPAKKPVAKKKAAAAPAKATSASAASARARP